jgi:hypothetical protein
MLSYPRVTTFVLCVFAFPLFLFAASAGQSTVEPAKVEQATHKIKGAGGVTLIAPMHWAVAESSFKNAVEIVTPPLSGVNHVPRARMLVTTEKRRSHEEALLRLSEIAEGSEAEPVFLEVGGWPAIQRRAIVERPELGRESDKNESDRKESDRKERPTDPYQSMQWRVTTVVAAGDLLLRMDTNLSLQDAALAKQAEAIGRTAAFEQRGKPVEIRQEIGKLRTKWAERPLGPVAPPGIGAINAGRLVLAQPIKGKLSPPSPGHDPVLGPGSEIAVAASSDGQNVVIATNAPISPGIEGFYSSQDGGVTYSPLAAVPAPATSGDPSATFGKSGNFYISALGTAPGPPFPGGPVAGCTQSVFVSTNQGTSFAFAGNAALCPVVPPPGGGVCKPDQPFLAADSINAAPGGDEVYAVWRMMFPFTVFGSPGTCIAFTGPAFAEIPLLACSTNSAATWRLPLVIGSGDRPRVTVGPDGFVYVVFRDDLNVMLHKFSSCSTGLAAVPGFPVLVERSLDPVRPLPGLDRFQSADLASATVAVDDTNPLHIYVAYAQSFLGSDSIIVQQSFDGGLSFGVKGVANTGPATRRFMPWVCSTKGAAFTSWYDRRFSAPTGSPPTNDLTDFFLGSVSGDSPLSFLETRLSGATDAQCANGWPLGSDADDDSTSCSTQPQIAGHCFNVLGIDINRATPGSTCDIATGSGCTGLLHCGTWGGGVPMYGDYNGIACAAGKVFTAWASRTTPSGRVFPSVFANTIPVPDSRLLSVTEVTQPANDGGLFNVQVDGQQVAVNLGNLQSSAPVPLAPGTHQVQDSSANGVLMTDYATTFGGDCNSSGQVIFSVPGAPLNCAITHATAAGACQASCLVSERSCFAQPNSETPQQCAADYTNCLQSCPAPPARAWLTVTMTVVPSTDMTAFAIWLGDQDIANRTIVNNRQIGQLQNGQSVGPIAITPADPNERGPHIVTVVGPGNFTYQFGGDCGPSQGTGPTQAAVDFGSGFGGTCAVTATHN